MVRGRERSGPQAREWQDEQNPTKQVSILHIDNLSSMATGIFLAHPRSLVKILEMRSSRPLAAVVPGTVDRVKETYPGSVSLEMSPTTLVVQDKGTNRSEERARLSPKIVDLALDEKPTSELTVDYLQTFGMKVDWEQVIKDVFTEIKAKIQDANQEVTILARYGRRIVKNYNDEQTTGFASMIIRVPQEKVSHLWKNSGKGLFVRQTQRANQELMQTRSEVLELKKTT